MRPKRFGLQLYVLILFFWGCAAPENEVSRIKFNSGEHVILGNGGYEKACRAYEGLCPPELLRLDGKKSFSYGELVAFSGDFYGTPEEIYREQNQPFYKWRRNDVDDIQANFIKEVETIENFLHGHSDEVYPDFNLSSAWNYPDYISLSLANSAHFGFYNILAYVRYHGQALELARHAHELLPEQSDLAEKQLIQAFFTNAFADHFLTDGFASGHIRNPRIQILNWAKTMELSDRTAGTLAKILHDRDGEIRESGEHGLKVTNARGDTWLTRCDAQLFWQNNLQDPAITLPMQAVDLSLSEVLQVFESGESIPGIYAATWLIPYPAEGERTLTQLFPPDLSEAAYDSLLAKLAFYLKLNIFSGIDKTVLKKFTAELPQLMQNFRKDVSIELIQNPELGQRLPLAYREAYRGIQ